MSERVRRVFVLTVWLSFCSATLHAQWPTPTAGIAFRAAAGTVVITWQPLGTSATYHVFRASDSTSRGTDLSGAIATPTFTDKAAQAGTLYFYHVESASAPGAKPMMSVSQRFIPVGITGRDAQTSANAAQAGTAKALVTPKYYTFDPLSLGGQAPGVQVNASLNGVNISGNGATRNITLDFTRWYGPSNPGVLLGGSVRVSFFPSQAPANSYFVGLDVENTVAVGDLVITRGDHDPGGTEINRCPITVGAQRCVAEVTMPGSTNLYIHYWVPSGYYAQINNTNVKSIVFGMPAP